MVSVQQQNHDTHKMWRNKWKKCETDGGREEHKTWSQLSQYDYCYYLKSKNLFYVWFDCFENGVKWDWQHGEGGGWK